jgi:hypothetical protein
MVHTSSALPTPQPVNTHPGWAIPPPVHPPGKGGKPGKDGDPNQPQNDGNNPQNYNQSDPSHQNFNQQDPSHPNQADPSQQQPNYNQPDPSHPNQADPSHPNQADPSHPNQADPSHPNQIDPSHPNQADPSHPNQYDPSHPNQADPSHLNQCDPPPNQNGTDPSQPGQNPSQNPPHSPHSPHRLPRLRLFGRRKKSDEQERPAVPMQSQFPQAGNATVVGSAIGPSQQYAVPELVAGGMVAPQRYAAPGSPPPQQPYNVSPISLVSPAPIHRKPVGEAEF